MAAGLKRRPKAEDVLTFGLNVFHSLGRRFHSREDLPVAHVDHLTIVRLHHGPVIAQKLPSVLLEKRRDISGRFLSEVITSGIAETEESLLGFRRTSSYTSVVHANRNIHHAR